MEELEALLREGRYREMILKEEENIPQSQTYTAEMGRGGMEGSPQTKQLIADRAQNMRLELHKLRLKNAELRQGVRKTEKERIFLREEIDKLRKSVAKSEKSREIVCILYFI